MRRLAFGSTLYVCSITSLAASSVLGLGLQPSKDRNSHNAGVICRTAIRILIFIRRLAGSHSIYSNCFLIAMNRTIAPLFLTVFKRRESGLSLLGNFRMPRSEFRSGFEERIDPQKDILLAHDSSHPLRARDALGLVHAECVYNCLRHLLDIVRIDEHSVRLELL